MKVFVVKITGNSLGNKLNDDAIRTAKENFQPI
jgi:hypothetical protein